MTLTFRLLEATTYRAPLGLRLTDPVGGADVADGLAAGAWPAGAPANITMGRRSPVSALIGFGDLPGLRGFEEAPSSLPPGPGRPFLVRIVDTQGRFLPELVAITLPQGLVVLSLFSAPARPAPAGWATARGEVWSKATGQPAGWAVVEVRHGAVVYRALADQLGRFVCHFPYPEALPPLAGSFPGGGPIDKLTWPVTVTLRYQPAHQLRPVDAGPGDPPELNSLLGQAPASILENAATQAHIGRILKYGQPLFVASRGRPTLFVDPAP